MMVLDDVNNSIETLRTSGDAVSKDLLIQGVTSRAKGRVVDIFSGEGVEKEIRYVQIGTRKFIPSEYIIYKDISDAIRIKSIREPEIDVYTGNILYINNNSKIQRDENQTETINFLITF
jgi:ribosomal protein S8